MEYHFGVLVILSRPSFGQFHIGAKSCSLGDYPVETSTWRLTKIPAPWAFTSCPLLGSPLVLVFRTDQINSMDKRCLIF